MLTAYSNAASAQKNKNEYNLDLMDAIWKHHMPAMMQAIANGADINSTDTMDGDNELMDPPLITAIIAGNLNALKKLLQLGAQVTVTSPDNVPVFMVAVCKGYYEMVQALLCHNANPNVHSTCSALEVAIAALPSLAVIRYSTWSAPGLQKKLLAWYYQEGEFADPTANDPSDDPRAVAFPEPTAPLCAIYEGMSNVISILLNAGVNPSEKNALDFDVHEILADPVKYQNEFGRTCATVQSADQDKLTFRMKLHNRNNSALTPEVTVVYDLATVRKKIARGVQPKGHEVDIKILHEEMKNVKEAVRYDETQEITRFKASIEGSSNAQEAYNTILSRLKSIHKSAQAVSGGGVVVSEGSLALLASVLDVGTNVIESIPLVGAAASKFFGLAALATRQVDGIRQTNIYENIAAMVPATGAGRIFESVARKLTLAYLPQFQRLLTREEAAAQMGSSTGPVQNALKSRFKSPSERIGEFAIIFMLEDVFHNMHALQNEIKKPNGLETLLLNAVMQRKPAQGVAMFWNTVTEKLGINQIPIRTQSGAISAETWSPEYFWTMPGIKVENSQGNTLYFAGNGTRPEIYGFRAGSRASVDALGLTPTTETSALAQAATPVVPTTTPTANSRLVTAPLPSPTSMTYAYGNTSASPNSANASRGLSVPTPKADKLDAPPSAPKRSKSPFSGFKLPGLRRGACPAPIATS